MLWCKETFEHHFDSSECRLFALQQQLFDFVDQAAAVAKTGHNDCRDAWLCFSIEFPSASEVSRLLSRHSARGHDVPALFRVKQTVPPAEKNIMHHRGKRPREDFALLYGDAPLSQQTRMFLATTLAGLRAILTDIEAAQLHLYEIIREGSPCHLYFDVEREGNHVALRRPVCVDDDDDGTGGDSNSSASSSVAADDSTVVVEDEVAGRRVATFQCGSLRYQELRRRASHVPEEVCGLDCPVEPCNDGTCDVLITQLEEFVRRHFPSLVPAAAGDSRRRERSPLAEVWVLESVPLSGVAVKFSQHYVVKLHGTVFDSTTSVKVFVRQFVAYVSRVAAESRSVHSALFFHGSPAWYSVFAELASDYPRNTFPFLPRRCVVDEAVYSKNRMMRCLGSCKLAKSSVLRLSRYYEAGVLRQTFPLSSGVVPITLADVEQTLISYRPVPGEVMHRLKLEESDLDSSDAVPSKLAVSSARATASSAALWESATLRDDGGSLAEVARAVQALYSRVAQAECIVSRPRVLQGRFVTFQVSGTRYCQHVGREHKSNNVYLVVDLEKKSVVQKCFDPDCASYRSPPLSLEEVVREQHSH